MLAFDRVIENYEEVKVTVGTIKCPDLYSKSAKGTLGGSENSGGKVTYKWFASQPTLSDYIADVELAIRASMDQSEFKSFLERDYTDKIKEKAGKEFMRRRIYPMNVYMKAKAK